MASVARLKMGKPGTGRMVGDKLVGRAIRIYIPLLLLLAVTLFPFYWMAVTSFKSASELFDFSVSPLWVREPTLDWYKHLFTQTNFPHWAFNTAVVATVSTIISLFCSVLAGYSLARLRYGAAHSALPTAYLRHPRAPSLQQPVGADPHVSHLPDSLLHLDADGLLQGHP